MNTNKLVKGTIIRTIFVSIEVIAIIALLVVTFSNDGTSYFEGWGYWENVASILVMFGPIIVYVFASAIFNIINIKAVFGNQHTPDSLRKYHKLSKTYFIWGIITGGLYGLPLPIFLLENIFLFNGYRNEIERIGNT